MKKMVMIVAMMLLGLTSVFAISGDAEVSLASTNALTGGTFSTDDAAQAITEGVAVTDLLVVDDLVVNDNSLDGWTLTITGTGTGVLTCAATSQTIAYTMQMANVSGTLGTGLDNSALEAGGNITLGTTAISPSGTASTPTENYTFDLVMDIAGAASEDKLVGTYVETLIITLAAD